MDAATDGLDVRLRHLLPAFLCQKKERTQYSSLAKPDPQCEVFGDAGSHHPVVRFRHPSAPLASQCITHHRQEHDRKEEQRGPDERIPKGERRTLRREVPPAVYRPVEQHELPGVRYPVRRHREPIALCDMDRLGMNHVDDALLTPRYLSLREYP